MATSTLRGIILVLAIGIGVVGLTEAIPEGGNPAFNPTPQGRQNPSPTASPTGASPSPKPSPKVKGVVVVVLNGSGVDGLAAETTLLLEDAGYSVREPGNAARIPTTTIFYQRGSKLEAEHVAEQFFRGARVERADPTAASDADITVVLGEDRQDAEGSA